MSFILLAARRRQGGAGGGVSTRAELKFVANRGGLEEDGVDATGAVARAAFCFFFFEAKLSF